MADFLLDLYSVGLWFQEIKRKETENKTSYWEHNNECCKIIITVFAKLLFISTNSDIIKFINF